MKKILWMLFIAIIIVGGGLFVIKTQTNRLTVIPTNISNLANPASVYCEQHSGTLEIITDESHAQLGICHLTGGIDCEERAYMRGVCPSTDNLVELIDNQGQYLLVFIQKSTENGLTIYGDIYDKDNLSNPVRSFNLPNYDTLIKTYFEMGYFNSKGEYYILTYAPDGYKQHLYKILLSGTIEQVPVTLPDSISGDEVLIGYKAFIDQENLKIAYVVNDSYITGENDNVISEKLAIYDILTKKNTITSYDTQNIKRKVTATTTPLPYPDYAIQRFDNFKNGIVEFSVDHDAVDGQTSDYFTTCFDINKNIELSSEECTQLFPKDRISYKITEEDSINGTETPLIIDGKDIGIFTGIFFMDIVGDSVLGYTESDYKFYKLQDVLNYNIK
ncbi:MAG: DUF333 domain-containing protein [Candidatus Absconditicoccaceae bacterium]